MSFTLIVLIASLMIGLSKGGLGGPVPVALLTPLLSFIMPASQAVGLVLPLLIFADMFALYIYWKQWDARQVRLMLPMGVLGVILGGILLLALAENNQNDLLRRLIGAFTLFFVIYKLSSGWLAALEYHPRGWHGYVAGWASGFGSALANMGAPPFTAYMLLQKTTPLTFVGTTTLFFAIINLLKLPITLMSSKVLNLHLLASILWAVPFIPVGVWLGRRFVDRVNAKAFENMMLILLGAMGLFLLLVTPGK
jgi:uncharacterized membrane protein YfcA